MTDLERKIPIEPLDAERVARLERDVLTAFRGMARDARPSRRWMVRPLLAAAAAAMVLVGWIALRSRGDGDAREVAAAMVQRVSTTAGPSRVDLGEAVITVDRDTEIEIHRDGGGIQVLLAHGAVDCEVAPRKDRPPFVVDAGEVDVTVVGTAFRVERDGEVRVSVTHGIVRVDAPDGARALAAGERWASRATIAVAPPAPAPERRAAVPAADPVLRDRKGTVVPPLPEHARTETTDPAGRRPADKHAAAAVRRPKIDPAHRVPRVGVAGPLDLGIDDPGTLITAYTNLVANDPRARHALYSIVWVQWFSQRDRGAAVRSAMHFERRFTGGEFAEDALIIRIMATCHAGPSEDCHAAAYTYLRRFAGGRYEDAARTITEWDVTR